MKKRKKLMPVVLHRRRKSQSGIPVSEIDSYGYVCSQVLKIRNRFRETVALLPGRPKCFLRENERNGRERRGSESCFPCHCSISLSVSSLTHSLHSLHTSATHTHSFIHSPHARERQEASSFTLGIQKTDETDTHAVAV